MFDANKYKELCIIVKPYAGWNCSVNIPTIKLTSTEMQFACTSSGTVVSVVSVSNSYANIYSAVTNGNEYNTNPNTTIEVYGR